MVIHQFFAEIEKLKIMVIGDVMIDRYLTGRVSRISPEAPVPVVAQVETEDRLGGAANVALNLKALGVSPILCGVVGQDGDSTSFFSLMENAGLSDAGLLASKTRQTTVKTRIIADRQHLLRLDKEDTAELDGNERGKFFEMISGELGRQKVDAIILQDYNKGVLAKNVIEWILAQAEKRKIPVAVDPKSQNFWAYKKVALFKPNLREIRDALKKEVQPELASLKIAAAELNRQLGHERTLVTLSDQGVFWSEDEEAHLVPTRLRKVADVCGAGDAVVSMAAVGLALKMEMGKIAMLANLVGGQVVERLGVVPIDKKQLEMELMREVV